MSASPDAIFKEGMAAFQAGDLRAAEKSFRKILRKHPDHGVTLGVLGAVLVGLKDYDDAARQLRSALKHNPKSRATIYNLGLALKGLHRPLEALTFFSKAIELDPRDPESFNNRGTVFNDLKKYDDAVADFDAALALKPDYAIAYCNKGKSLSELTRYDDAVAALDKARALNPNLVEVWLGLGFTYIRMKRHRQAAEAYANVRRLRPAHPFLKGIILHQKMLICDWAGTDAMIAEIEADIQQDKPSAEPFGWQGVATTSRSLLQCAKIYNRLEFPTVGDTRPRFAKSPRDKIRIGYLSGEFRNQATAMLMAGVFAHHDKSRFEIFAFDNGWDDDSVIRKRIETSVDRMTAIRHLDDDAAAALIRDSQIDILVNLNGYFGEHRSAVFARRPAPVQVNYLGFPGTLGADTMDYLIADHEVIPAGDEQFYSEKIVRLPNCYQANDNARVIADKKFSRADFGLPADGFVFCCFNNNYKITPSVFDGWMRILQRVEGSVLWLIDDSADVADNLRREATQRGIDGARIILSGRIPPDEHLARHRCADLFLDTSPYNAHTTASDALWSGLPVLTCEGQTFAGRVAASLLKTIGLNEMIARTQDDYENMAVALATEPERLVAIVAKLAANRLTTPLFDTRRFTRHLELGFQAMHERRQAGLNPQPFDVADA